MQTLLGGLRIFEGLKEIVSFRSGALKPEPMTIKQAQDGAVGRKRQKGAAQQNPDDLGSPRAARQPLAQARDG
jgi:hypothetical protein